MDERRKRRKEREEKEGRKRRTRRLDNIQYAEEYKIVSCVSRCKSQNDRDSHERKMNDITSLHKLTIMCSSIK